MSRLSRLAQLAASVAADPQAHVPSPCVSICVMNPVTGWCEGCLRTLGEIGDWAQADIAAKRQVWQTIAERIPTAEIAA
jgi:predicted Fe-S protein YdhL (DUF1289 family)